MPINYQTMIEIAAFALVAMILGLFVVRPALTAEPLSQLPGLPSPQAGRAEADPEGAENLPALTGTIDDDNGPLDFDPPMARAGGREMGFPPMDGVDPVARLRQLIADRRDETVEILRNWMEETEDAE